VIPQANRHHLLLVTHPATRPVTHPATTPVDLLVTVQATRQATVLAHYLVNLHLRVFILVWNLATLRPFLPTLVCILVIPQANRHHLLLVTHRATRQVTHPATIQVDLLVKVRVTHPATVLARHRVNLHLEAFTPVMHQVTLLPFLRTPV
jgi:hypothetical protein